LYGFKIWNNNDNKKKTAQRKASANKVSSALKQIPSTTITEYTNGCDSIWKQYTMDHYRKVSNGDTQTRLVDIGIALFKPSKDNQQKDTNVSNALRSIMGLHIKWSELHSN